ncbi:MAG: M56 family metallopeptidase, partial [Bacteroidales bacterium]|nr:M56 family metallopeptidase [Bacteroidales bacterium]
MNTIFLAEWWSEYLLPSAASLAVFYLLYKLVIRNDTYLRSRRFLILAFLLFAIMLPFLSFQLPMNITASTVENPVFYRDIISTPTPVVATEMASPAADNIAENTISIWDIVGLIYAAVVLFLLIRFIAGVLHLAIIAKNGKRIQANGATIILSPNFTTAFSFFHLTFMPETWYNSNERNVVLKHEHVHIVQKHSWDLVLMELICVVQFFNPFVWLLRHEMRLNHEFLADRGALESSNNTAQYFQLLLQKILGKQPILVNSFNYSPIKQRIIMTTLKKQAKILSSARYFAFVLVALSLTILFAGKANSTTSTTASTSENTKYLFLNA